MSRAKERKIKMLLMIGFAVLSTSSLAAATFAWFTVIPARMQSGTMTVTSVDAFDFYAYKGNPDDSYVPEHEGNDFEDDFVLLDENTSPADLALYTSLSGIAPGKAMTFAFKYENRTSASVEITKLTSNDGVMQNLSQKCYVANQATTTPVNVGWAINIYTTAITTTSGYADYVNDPSDGYTAEDLFLYDELSANSAYHRANYLAGTTSSNIVTLTNPLTVFQSDSLSGDTYILLSVMFSDESSTYFQEVDGDSGTASPIDIAPESGNRYFRKATTGNSNCYGNLSFAINEIRLK